MKYLGVPVTYRNLRVSDLDPLDKKFIKKLDAWVGGANSSGGRLTLVNACMSSLPSYFVSLFLLCKTFWRKWVNIGDEGMTPQVLDIGLPATTQEQEGHSKPKKPKTS
jgi:hypothetical protein